MNESWYYLGVKGAEGPKTTEEICALLESGQLDGDAMLKPADGTEWRSIKDYGDFKSYFPERERPAIAPGSESAIPKRKWKMRLGWMKTASWVVLMVAAVLTASYVNKKYALFQRITDVSSEDYDVLRQAALSPLKNGIAIGVAISSESKEAPIIYLSSNELDRTQYDIRLEGKPGTLMGAKSAFGRAMGEVKHHIWKSYPLQSTGGGALPVGRYRVDVRHVGNKGDPLYSTEILFLGTTSPAAYDQVVTGGVAKEGGTVAAAASGIPPSPVAPGEVVANEGMAAAGGVQDLPPESDRKPLTHKERVQLELREVSELIAGIKRSIVSSKRVFSDVSPEASKESEAVWAKHKKMWMATDLALTKRFGAFKGDPEFEKSQFIFKTLNKSLFEIWLKTQSYHRRQNGFFEGVVPEEERDQFKKGMIEDIAVLAGEVDLLANAVAQEKIRRAN